MDDLPVLENSRDDKEGLMESVKSIHGMIDQALETGITPEMVVLVSKHVSYRLPFMLCCPFFFFRAASAKAGL
jgi:hypothetical protein